MESVNVEVEEVLEECLKVEIVDPYGFIYITTNMVNGKKYIGQKKFGRKWEDYLGSGKYFKNALNKYGKDYFKREIIAIAYNKDKLDELEIGFIMEHDATNSSEYYNISRGGGSNAGIFVSQETRNKISSANKGKIVSEETRQKLRDANIGKTRSEETKLKMSGTGGVNHQCYGKEHSEETKRKISKANKGRKLSEETKLKMRTAVRVNTKKKRTVEHSKKISIANRKINKEQSTEIRIKYSTGEYSQRKLAEEYFVTQTTIGDVVNFVGVYKDDISIEENGEGYL